jgi:hypothetical protein
MKKIAITLSASLMLAPIQSMSQSDWRADPKSSGNKARVVALQECAALSTKLRGETRGSQGFEFFIVAAGVVSGSILVPALSASASASKELIAGLGGVSGAVNGLQYAWSNEGLGASGRARVYQTFSRDIKDQLREAAATTDENTAIGKYMALEEYCRLTPPIADIADQSDAAVTATKAAFESNVAQLKLAQQALEKANAEKLAAQKDGEAALATATQNAKNAEEQLKSAKDALDKAKNALVAASEAQTANLKVSSDAIVKSTNAVSPQPAPTENK